MSTIFALALIISCGGEVALLSELLPPPSSKPPSQGVQCLHPVLTCLLFFFICEAYKCFPLRVPWQEVANYCSGSLAPPHCAPPAGSAGLETHLNIDQAPGRAVWGPGPLACSRALLMGSGPSCQYHSSTWT